MFVSGSDHFRIAYRATRLDDRRGTGIGNDVEAVTEWDERIGSDNGTFQRQSGIFGLHGSRTGCIDTAHLAGTDAQRHAVSTENDRVRFDEFDDFGCKEHVSHLLRSRLLFGYDLQVGCDDVDDVR